MSLPVEAVRPLLLSALPNAPVVLTSPTGSGKSTQVPRWLAAADKRVLVIEPRRVAASSLARHVAALEHSDPGQRIGYQVRDERVWGRDTAVVYVTPGIVLAQLEMLSTFDVVIFDEFHERRLDTDLLLALVQSRADRRLVVMSATLDSQRLTDHLGATLVEVDVPLFPVEVRYRPGEGLLPGREELGQRVWAALEELREVPGDVLVFLPGKAEIRSVAERLRGSAYQVLELHGGLSLKQQTRVLQPGTGRRAVLATNVAETSVTVPGVSCVVDAGLVRRTRYREGRGQLALVPIAGDSATQRKGRAGRTGPGVCVRLWSERARLEPRTPPEMFRESLVPLVLACAELGVLPENLSFVDPPPEHALSQARAELAALGGLDAAGRPTAVGRELFRLPIDAHLGRLLVSAREAGVLGAMVELVAVLAVGRPLFKQRPFLEEDDPDRGCDASLRVRALRGEPELAAQAEPHVLAEARRVGARLRRSLGLPETGGESWDRALLLGAALKGDGRLAHVARRRGKRFYWSNGGTELELARESTVTRLCEDKQPGEGPPPQAVVVWDSVSLGTGARGGRVLATCASTISLQRLAQLGLGQERVAHVRYRGGVLTATVERVHARLVLSEEDRQPRGELARQAVAALWLRGSLWPESLAKSRERLLERSLAARLGRTARGAALGFEGLKDPLPLENWISEQLSRLGLETGEDLELLSPDDLLIEPLAFELRGTLEQEYPLKISLGDASYVAEYDLESQQVLLRLVRGQRAKPPPREYLPRFEGLKVCVEAGRTMHVLPTRRGP